MEIKITKKTILLRGISIRIEDIRRIVERLQVHVEEEGHREISQLMTNELDDAGRQERLNAEREAAFRITVTICGKDGEELFGYGLDPFDSPNIPDPIQSIFITNTSSYHTIAGRNPTNNFTLHFDFSTPPLIDNNNPVSDPTPNNSNFMVEGNRDSWVASIEKSVMDIIGKRSNKRSVLHVSFVYDVGLLVFGFPFAFYTCWRLSNFIKVNLGEVSSIVAAAAYVYVFFFSVTMYRVLFGYTKWAFPVVELANVDNTFRIHRRFWYAILVSIVGSGVYEAFS